MPAQISYRRGGLTLKADLYDNPGPRTALLVHGVGQTRHSWHRVAMLLAARGWRAVSLDLRGHGDSDWAPHGAYAIEDFADDLRLVAGTFPQPPALVGASMGGSASLVAIAEAADPSAIASALVMVDVAPNINPEGAERVRSFMSANRHGFAELSEVADAIAAYNPHRPRPTSLDGLRKIVRLREDGRWYWHWDPRLIAAGRDGPRFERKQERLEAAARELTLPSLLVRGARSDVLSEAGARRLRELIPHAEYVDVAGAGHMVAGDRNDVFAGAIVEFLDRVQP